MSEPLPTSASDSYYGRPIVKPSPWELDIPVYLYSGGLAAASSLLAAGADLTGRPGLRRVSRISAFAGISVSLGALVHDLGRPERFLNMLRVVKPTSPMSVGTWLLMTYGPFAGLAAAAEVSELLPRWVRSWALVRLLRRTSRPAGLIAAVTSPPVATYTAVLLSNTATPSWHAARSELPFVFAGSAATAAAGVAMVGAPVHQASPARRLAVGGFALEMAAQQRMEKTMGVTAEPLHQGKAGSWMRAARNLGVAGIAGTLLSGRSRAVAAASGLALMASSACTRMGIFEAGQASAADPKYTVEPQREQLAAGYRADH